MQPELAQLRLQRRGIRARRFLCVSRLHCREPGFRQAAHRAFVRL